MPSNALGFDTPSEPAYLGDSSLEGSQKLLGNTPPTFQSTTTAGGIGGFAVESNPYNTITDIPTDWSTDTSFVPWLWSDTGSSADFFGGLDTSMDLDNDVDWYNWIQSTQAVETGSWLDVNGVS